MSMIGYKMLYRDLRSIWFHYPYERGTIHTEIGKPVVYAHGFHFYETIEDIPDIDKYLSSISYVLVKVEALGDIVSKSQAQPPYYTERMVYCTNAIRVIHVESRSTVVQMRDFIRDEAWPLGFVVSDYKQFNSAYVREEYGRISPIFLHQSSEYAYDEQSRERRAAQPDIFYIDSSNIIDGPDPGNAAIVVGHPDELTEEQKEGIVVIAGTLIDGGEVDPVWTYVDFAAVGLALGMYEHVPVEPTIEEVGPIRLGKTDGTILLAVNHDGTFIYKIKTPSIYYIDMNEEFEDTYDNITIQVACEGEVIIRIRKIEVENTGSIPFIAAERSVTKMTIQTLTSASIKTGGEFLRSPSRVIISGSGRLLIESTNPELPAIYSADNLYVSVIGGLDVTAEYHTVYAKNIVFESGSVSTLRSTMADTIHATNNIIVENGSTVRIPKCQKNGFSSDNEVTIDGGIIDIETFGNGIRAMKFTMNDGTVDIHTKYLDAGVDYYDRNRGARKYNMLEYTPYHTMLDTVIVNPGIHHGIYVGIEECTYVYNDDPETIYTQKGSGTCNINGGTLTINVAETGLTYYNGAPEKYRKIGAPADGIHCGSSTAITGGTIKISASNYGIFSAKSLVMKNAPKITIDKSFHGLVTNSIASGISGGTYGPTVDITSFGDICLLTLFEHHYEYADETKERYSHHLTFTGSSAAYTTHSGIYTMKLPESAQRVYLNSSAGSRAYEVRSFGYGVYIRGNAYLYGGNHKIYTNAWDETDPLYLLGDTYSTGTDLTALMTGADTHNVRPTYTRVAYVPYEASLDRGVTMGIMAVSQAETIYSEVIQKNVSYVFYSTGKLVAGSRYALLKNDAIVTSAGAMR